MKLFATGSSVEVSPNPTPLPILVDPIVIILAQSRIISDSEIYLVHFKFRYLETGLAESGNNMNCDLRFKMVIKWAKSKLITYNS